MFANQNLLELSSAITTVSNSLNYISKTTKIIREPIINVYYCIFEPNIICY
jgi:hypothetical protein